MRETPVEDALQPATGFVDGDLSIPLGPRGRSPVELNGMAHRHYQGWAVGDGSATEFALPVTVLRGQDLRVCVGGVVLRPAARGTAYDYAVRGLTPGYAGDTNRVRFVVAPVVGVEITFDVVGG